MGKDYHSSNANPLQLRSMFNNSSNNPSKASYSNVIESVRFYENAIQELQAQIDQAKIMVRRMLSSLMIVTNPMTNTRWMN